MKYKHPTRKECFHYLEVYNTPNRVIRHCIAVTDVALKIGRALNEHGYKLDLQLIEAAGLLHDISRVEREHWIVGSKIVRKWGYTKEADIILVHMTYSRFSPIERINETDLVCIGDRLVKEDKYVGIDERMDYIIEKVKSEGRPDVVEQIMRKKNEMKKLLEDIENVIGMSLDELLE